MTWDLLTGYCVVMIQIRVTMDLWCQVISCPAEGIWPIPRRCHQCDLCCSRGSSETKPGPWDHPPWANFFHQYVLAHSWHSSFQLNFPGLPQILDISKLACPGLADVGMKLATFGRTMKTKGISAKSGSWFLFSTRFANWAYWKVPADWTWCPDMPWCSTRVLPRSTCKMISTRRLTDTSKWLWWCN
jgi:hypothetical protein